MSAKRIVASASLVCVLASSAASRADDLEGGWAQKGPHVHEYEYEVHGLPDFDQVRSGLPGCGLNYCVPTATANLLAWIANHGFPSVGPGPGDWSAPGAHAAMTAYIKTLGESMNTSASSGTKRSSWFFALAGGSWPWPEPPLLPPKTFTVTAMFVNDSYKPRMYVAVKSAILNDGLLALCHGWYGQLACTDFPCQPNYRDGGHCLSVQRVEGYWIDGAPQYGADVWLHDSASHEGFFAFPASCSTAWSPSSQSPFAAHRYDLSLDGLYSLPPWCQNLISTLDQLYLPGSGDFCSTPRLADAYLMISLKKGYGFTQNAVSQIAAGLTFGPTPPPQAKTIAEVADIVSAALAPDLASIVAVASDALVVIDPLLHAVEPLPPGDYFVKWPTAVAFGRDRALFVAHAGGIARIDLDGDGPVEVATAHPPNPCDLLVYDDRSDRLVALSTATHTFYRFDAALAEQPNEFTLPAVQFGSDPTLVADPLDGSLWIGSGAATLTRVSLDGIAPVVQTWSLDGVVGPIGGFDIDSAGHLLASIDGLLREFERHPTGTHWIPVADSPFDGSPGGTRFLVTRSRTNLDPPVHDGPEWDDRFPPISPEAVFCLADFDGSGGVDAPDLAILLGAWGGAGSSVPADLDDDGLVGAIDLGILLGAWGPCFPYETAPPLLVVDACEAATLVAEGIHPFSTLEASSDGMPLPAACDEGAGTSFGQDVWALYLPSASGTITVSTCGHADYDSRLAAYGGFCSDATLIACDDDSPGCGLSSTMTFATSVDESILIRVGGYGGAAGTGSLSIAIDPTIVADGCTDALVVGEGAFPFDTTAATTDGPPLPSDCDEGFGLAFGPDVWALLVPAASGIATVSTCGAADFDTRLAAYRFECPSLALLACDDDSPSCPGFTSTIAFPVTTGEPVRIRIGGFGSTIGTGTLSISIVQ